MATLSDIRQQVRDYIGEPTAQHWSDVLLNRLINNAYREVAIQTRCVGSDWTDDTGADQSDYPLPEQLMLPPDGVIYDYTGTPRQLAYTPMRSNWATWKRAGSGTPVYYTVLRYKQQHMLRLMPAPSSASKQLYVWGAWIPDSLSADNDVLEMPLQAHEAVALLAAYKAFAEWEEWDQANQLLQFYVVARDNVIADMKSGGPIVDTQGTSGTVELAGLLPSEVA